MAAAMTHDSVSTVTIFVTPGPPDSGPDGEEDFGDNDDDDDDDDGFPLSPVLASSLLCVTIYYGY
jgi:hypothetical protein